VSRTFGTYKYVPLGNGEAGVWRLVLDPAVAIRAKRVFARAQSTIAGHVELRATPEVAHDLEWFMLRFPLVPADDRTAEQLRRRSNEHEVRERAIGEVLAGTAQRWPLEHAPIKEPRPYQQTAVDLLRVSRRMILTDEVGLGKTFTGLLSLHPDALPAVIVQPTHLVSRWVTEMQDAFPHLSYDIAKKTTVPESFENGDRPDVLIVPYSRLAGWAHHLQGWARTIIFDEVQDLRRGTSTNKGTAAAMIAAEADYVLGLTATPVYNYGGEVWELFNIVAPGQLGTQIEFSREWGGYSYNGHAGVKDPGALGSYLREQGMMLGRTRKEVGRELPKTIKVPTFVEADADALEKVAGDAAAMARLILSDTSSRQEKFRAAGELDWKLREATGLAKAPYVAEFVKLLLEAERKVVLFGWHRAVYDVWNDMLADYRPVMYTGSESTKQKDEAREAFINGPSRILIMSLRSGAGVDGLQLATNIAVFGELDWSPAVHEQAIGRVRRDGMGEEPPVAYFLNSAEGSDPAILETLGVKRNQAEPLISGDGKLLQNSTNDTSRARALAEHVLALNGS
jgi:SNF2 family DNA or RNA helicase